MFSEDLIEGIKLTDFGLSSQYTLDTGSDDKYVTGIFMAPEQAIRRVYNKPVDIWSCGIVMYMLLTGKHPLSVPGDTVTSYFANLKKKTRNGTFQVSSVTWQSIYLKDSRNKTLWKYILQTRH